MKKSGKSPEIKAVLFDLGKVIVRFNFEPAFTRMARACGTTEKEVEDYFVSSGLEVLYDGGKISSHRFYLEIKKALGHKLSFKQFKRIWNEIFTPIPETIRLIKRLEKTHRLVLISNTNAMHYEYIRKKFPILKSFDRIVLSYREKMRKPDERLYEKARKACRAKAEEILYIDDRADLTGAAEELGFRVFTFKMNHNDLLKEMRRLSVIR